MNVIMPPAPRQLDAAEIRSRTPELAEILVDCVEGGASIGFIQPFGTAEATDFWAKVADEVEMGQRILFAVELEGRLAGACQLVLASAPNQPHRADVAKMLVHRRARCRGLGAGLLSAVEEKARSIGRWVLVLDTVPGSDAVRLYRKAGWIEVGDIPNYAAFPDGRLSPTTFFYKQLRG